MHRIRGDIQIDEPVAQRIDDQDDEEPVEQLKANDIPDPCAYWMILFVHESDYT